MGRSSKWSPEFREAVRMYRESEESIAAVARRLGLGPETFRRWVRDDEVERGQRDGTTREEHVEIVKLRREVRRLEEEKLILQKAAAYFACGRQHAHSSMVEPAGSVDREPTTGPRPGRVFR
jgi:transposase